MILLENLFLPSRPLKRNCQAIKTITYNKCLFRSCILFIFSHDIILKITIRIYYKNTFQSFCLNKEEIVLRRVSGGFRMINFALKNARQDCSKILLIGYFIHKKTLITHNKQTSLGPHIGLNRHLLLLHCEPMQCLATTSAPA